MILDNLNIYILTKILDLEETTTWRLAKKYNWSDKPFNFLSRGARDYFYLKKNMLIKQRLNVFKKEGLVKIKKIGNKNIYNVLEDRVKKCLHKIPKGKRQCLMILQDNSKWLILEL